MTRTRGQSYRRLSRSRPHVRPVRPTISVPRKVSLPRVCFVLRVRPERLEEYRERHRHVWQEMRDALQRAGWRDYSLFLAPDGLLVGYLTCDDFEACLQAMHAEEVNVRWQAEMTPFFLTGDRADESMTPLEEVFHLD